MKLRSYESFVLNQGFGACSKPANHVVSANEASLRHTMLRIFLEFKLFAARGQCINKQGLNDLGSVLEPRVLGSCVYNGQMENNNCPQNSHKKALQN